MQLALRPEEDGEVQATWDSGRWMRVRLAHAKGKRIMNIRVVSGIVEQKRSNAAL